MTHEIMKLGDLCNIATGIPTSRAKKLSDGETGIKVKALTPRAMEGGGIVDSALVFETVSKVKDDLFSRERDVIVKVSTPYDCVYVDKEHEGLLLTSFAIILRAKTENSVDMRYLAGYLNQPQSKKMLQDLSVGLTLQLIKKAALVGLDIPVIPKNQQVKLATLFENTQRRKKQCLDLIAKSDQLLEAEFTRAAFN